MSSARWRATDVKIRQRSAILPGVLIVSSFVLIAFANYHASGLTD